MVKKDGRKQAGPKKVPLGALATGVPGLDDVLGGGLPQLSFNLITGDPGSGKTTLAMQMMFASATVARPGLYFTLLGEPSLKMLRYQQQFDFFDPSRIGSEVQFFNLSEQVLAGDLKGVLTRIVEEVGRLHPGIVVIDSFRTLARTSPDAPGTDRELEHFAQRLALHLTSWDIASFLVGEYTEAEFRNPIFTVADGIIWLTQAVHRNSVVRKLQVLKMRGIAGMPGVHTLRMTDKGVQVFPRIFEHSHGARAKTDRRRSTGVPDLDEMMGGGVPVGGSMILAGPTGTGKTTFATQFAAAGIRQGEPCVIAVFEEHPEDYLERATSYGVDFREAERQDKLRIIYLRPLDLSVDETLEGIRVSVKEIGATRVVIDSISGFEMALAPTFREDFRESLYRLVGALTGLGVTVFMTEEVTEQKGIQFTNNRVSFLTDVIVIQRYVEIEGQLRKVLAVVKMRGSSHSGDFRAYEITGSGVLLREGLRNYHGITTGVPTKRLQPRQPAYPGLTEQEGRVLEILIRSGAESAEAIAEEVGLPPSDLDPILERLTQLAYVSRKGNRYQGVARPSSS
ncbi:MAG: AAA family ATPase [Gemmatimonadales bacterium]|nr:AAA family ATPase [Gemmatimonadales bacterium]